MLIGLALILFIVSYGALPLSEEHILVILCFVFLSVVSYTVYDMFAAMSDSENLMYMETIETVDAVAADADVSLDFENLEHDNFNYLFAAQLAEIGLVLPELLLDVQMFQIEEEINQQVNLVLENAIKNKMFLDHATLLNIMDSFNNAGLMYQEGDYNNIITEENMLFDVLSLGKHEMLSLTLQSNEVELNCSDMFEQLIAINNFEIKNPEEIDCVSLVPEENFDLLNDWNNFLSNSN